MMKIEILNFLEVDFERTKRGWKHVIGVCCDWGDSRTCDLRCDKNETKCKLKINTTNDTVLMWFRE